MVSKPNSNKQREIRHARVRNKISGTADRPRLNVYRSLNNIYAQVIDDTTGCTLVSASTLDEEIKASVKNTGNKEAAKAVLAWCFEEKGFDRTVLSGRGCGRSGSDTVA